MCLNNKYVQFNWAFQVCLYTFSPGALKKRKRAVLQAVVHMWFQDISFFFSRVLPLFLNCFEHKHNHIMMRIGLANFHWVKVINPATNCDAFAD